MNVADWALGTMLGLVALKAAWNVAAGAKAARKPAEGISMHLWVDLSMLALAALASVWTSETWGRSGTLVMLGALAVVFSWGVAVLLARRAGSCME